MCFSVLTQQKNKNSEFRMHIRGTQFPQQREAPISCLYLIFHYHVTNIGSLLAYVFYPPYIYFYDNFIGTQKLILFPLI